MLRGTPVIASRRSSLAKRLVPVLALAGLLGGIYPAAARNQLPDLGDAAAEVFGRAEEKRLGEAFLRRIRRNLRLIDDPEITDYVDSLGQRIARLDPDRDYRFLVVDNPTVNAFAGPNGIIAVNAGLMVVTETEGELAAVLAHEIAHVTQRHLARMIERSQSESLTTLASVLAAIVLSAYDPSAGQAVITARVAGAQQSALRYSRTNEMEADRAGMILLDRAGFDPRAVPTFFERFRDWQRFASQPPEYLSTHPVTVSRIADTESRAERFAPREYHESPEFSLMRAKVRVWLAARPADVMGHFQARVEAAGGEASEADRYGNALALMAANRHRKARTLLEALRRDYPDRPAHRLAMAKTYSVLGERERALDLLAESVALFPEHRGLVYAHGLELIEAGRPEEATAAFRTYQRGHDSDPTIHRLLGLAHQRAGRLAASHAALAEFYYRDGDFESALGQLEIALSDPSIGEYLAARVQARLEQLTEERAELRARN